MSSVTIRPEALCDSEKLVPLVAVHDASDMRHYAASCATPRLVVRFCSVCKTNGVFIVVSAETDVSSLSRQSRSAAARAVWSTHDHQSGLCRPSHILVGRHIVKPVCRLPVVMKRHDDVCIFANTKPRMSKLNSTIEVAKYLFGETFRQAAQQ